MAGNGKLLTAQILLANLANILLVPHILLFFLFCKVSRYKFQNMTHLQNICHVALCTFDNKS